MILSSFLVDCDNFILHYVTKCTINKLIYNCIPRTKYVRGILWFSRRYAAASADTSSFSR